jgi:hypothetical protein
LPGLCFEVTSIKSELTQYAAPEQLVKPNGPSGQPGFRAQDH